MLPSPDREMLKQQLLAQQAQLEARLAQLRGGNVSRAEASAEHFNYSEDSDAQVTTAKELELALDAHESAELQSIRAALERMVRGDYGLCTDCGQAISLPRLNAFPEAARCINCQTAAEAA